MTISCSLPQSANIMSRPETDRSRCGILTCQMNHLTPLTLLCTCKCMLLQNPLKPLICSVVIMWPQNGTSCWWMPRDVIKSSRRNQVSEQRVKGELCSTVGELETRSSINMKICRIKELHISWGFQLLLIPGMFDFATSKEVLAIFLSITEFILTLLKQVYSRVQPQVTVHPNGLLISRCWQSLP